jgi:hypothetical protein
VGVRLRRGVEVEVEVEVEVVITELLRVGVEREAEWRK